MNGPNGATYIGTFKTEFASFEAWEDWISYVCGVDDACNVSGAPKEKPFHSYIDLLPRKSPLPLPIPTPLIKLSTYPQFFFLFFFAAYMSLDCIKVVTAWKIMEFNTRVLLHIM